MNSYILHAIFGRKDDWFCPVEVYTSEEKAYARYEELKTENNYNASDDTEWDEIGGFEWERLEDDIVFRICKFELLAESTPETVWAYQDYEDARYHQIGHVGLSTEREYADRHFEDFERWQLERMSHYDTAEKTAPGCFVFDGNLYYEANVQECKVRVN